MSSQDADGKSASYEASAADFSQKSLWRKLNDLLFGYDYFISYAWADGRKYAATLAEKLEERRLECFLDSDDYAKGDNWKLVGQRALKKTSRLILIGSPKALESKPVLREVQIYTKRGRHVIPISFDGTLDPEQSTAPVLDLIAPEILRVIEPLPNLESGPPDDVVDDLATSFKLLTQDQKRTRVFAAAALVFAAVAALAVWFWRSSEANFQEAEEQRREAVKRERQARHEQGVGWLARSTFCARNKDFLSAKLMAMKAIGYQAFRANEDKGEELLYPESPEFNEAFRQIVSLPEYNILYVTRFDSNKQLPWAQCRFDWSGTHVTAISSSGDALKLDLRDGTVEQTRYAEGHVSRLAANLRRDGLPKINQGDDYSGRILIANESSARIALDYREGMLEWLDGGVVTKTLEVPEDALWAEENDDNPELIDLQSAALHPTVVAAFLNRFIQSVVVFRRDGNSELIYTANGEMSDDSGIVRCTSMCISDNGQLMVIAETDGNLTVYQKGTDGRFAGQSPFLFDGGRIENLTLSHDRRFLAGSTGQSVRVWDLEQKRLISTLTGHRSPVSHVDLSPDRRSLASVSDDGILIVWDVPLADCERINTKDLPLTIRQKILGPSDVEEQLPSPEGAETVSSLAPGRDLKATWDRYQSYAGQGSEPYYGRLSVVDTATGTEVLLIKATDDPLIDAVRFSGNGRFVLLRQEDRDFEIVPICRPRRNTAYDAAYSFVEFTATGIEVAKNTGTVSGVPIEANFSMLFLARAVPTDLLQDAIKWYYNACEIPMAVDLREADNDEQAIRTLQGCKGL